MQSKKAQEKTPSLLKYKWQQNTMKRGRKTAPEAVDFRTPCNARQARIPELRGHNGRAPSPLRLLPRSALLEPLGSHRDAIRGDIPGGDEVQPVILPTTRSGRRSGPRLSPLFGPSFRTLVCFAGEL